VSGGHRLEHDREAAHGLEPEGLLGELRRCLGRAALGLEAAEGSDGLGRQADVAHDGDARVDDRAGALDGDAAALEFDRVASGLLDEALRVGDRLLVRGLIGAEGEVPDQQRGLDPPADGG
jgi:hypothetical protein